MCESFSKITENLCDFKEFIMCDEKNKCQQPEKLEEKPEECAPEQIEECHGDVKEHPCTEDTEKKEQ